MPFCLLFQNKIRHIVILLLFFPSGMQIEYSLAENKNKQKKGGQSYVTSNENKFTELNERIL